MTLDGWTRVIADSDHPGPARVGRYGVDVAAIDALVERSLAAFSDVAVFLVDEVGKMECHSTVFVSAMRRLLASSTPLVATVAERGGGFMAEVCGLRGAELWTVTPQNRGALPQRVLQWLGRGPGTAELGELARMESEHMDRTELGLVQGLW